MEGSKSVWEGRARTGPFAIARKQQGNRKQGCQGEAIARKACSTGIDPSRHLHMPFLVHPSRHGGHVPVHLDPRLDGDLAPLDALGFSEWHLEVASPLPPLYVAHQPYLVPEERSLRPEVVPDVHLAAGSAPQLNHSCGPPTDTTSTKDQIVRLKQTGAACDRCFTFRTVAKGGSCTVAEVAHRTGWPDDPAVDEPLSVPPTSRGGRPLRA